ncbi:RHS repeat-associated core domain-containing protein [Lysinibacillus sp. JNUCC 51]|uniref:RHS repeat-associated core domain-containing protein n=1 Tax=Lysinibacillus sp. JNUCC-51 TaxID=2792479 RepID=UPI001938D1DA|nr:AHH domain-containing protein [Lysinibacillus sp. JNUCC-51]
MNRLRANLSAGNDIQLKYNADDVVVFARGNHTQVAFDYTILGSLISRDQGGKKVKFAYDTEEQLTAVINEKGEVYQFERDSKGNIIKEIGFDDIERTYERSLAGLVQRIQRPGDRWTAYQHDGLGNVIRADYYDDTWETFGYDKNGSLIETENEHVTVKLELDPVGQVINEWQNDHWIASSYDDLGNRSQITSSLGAKIDVARNEMGNVSQITTSRSEQKNWTASMQYNELGQEIERILPGDVISEWQYDATGKPTHHRISSQNRDTRRRAYNWDVNHRLRSMVNELTGVKVTYGYDEFSNLVWSNQGGQFDFLHRSVDDVGNLYETKEKTDRVYGAGSRLLETKEATFTYDDKGNLIQKIEKNGDTWKYEYNGNGMMSKVIMPDNTEVTFKYDSIGRRIEKCSNEKITKFIWDGNTILHEYISQDNSDKFENPVEYSSENKSEIPDNLVTWVFNGGFVPSAKITSEGNYSIISDYLGTPVEAFDEEGNRVWSAELDVYGRAVEFTGKHDFIPFRYQGQYEDMEIGLYYNRFRYYSPIEGVYTQQDPIGLFGGIRLYGYVSDTNLLLDVAGLKSNSAILGGNLGSKPGTNYDAHHIVMAGASDTRMVALRTKMANFKPPIDINSKENGIWLPRTDNDRVINDTSTAHKGHGVHGDDYKQKAYDRLNNKNTRKEFLKELKTIKKELSNGVKFKCKK